MRLVTDKTSKERDDFFLYHVRLKEGGLCLQASKRALTRKLEHVSKPLFLPKKNWPVLRSPLFNSIRCLASRYSFSLLWCPDLEYFSKFMKYEPRLKNYTPLMKK